MSGRPLPDRFHGYVLYVPHLQDNGALKTALRVQFDTWTTVFN